MTIDRDAVELLPCPFCGWKEPRLTANKHANMAWVACPDCGIEAPSETGVTEEDAVAYWNRRSALEALSAREATEGGEAVHQCREIGEGDWRDCTKSEYDRLQTDPHHDTRTITRAPEGEPTARIATISSLRSASIPPSGVAEARAEALEAAARECEAQAKLFLSPEYAFNQPIGSIPERFACAECATAIRNLIPSKEAE